MAESLIPLAEHFHSIQGEGTWVGTPMHFIRLAGCPVGAAATHDWNGPDHDGDLLPILSSGAKASMCRTYDGRFFTCDTDFGVHERITPAELADTTHEKHVCLTGGEPLVHVRTAYFEALFNALFLKNIYVHIETSGTIYDERLFSNHAMRPWITVAPKARFDERAIERADEVKLLVDDDFDIKKVPRAVLTHNNVFLSPINDELTVDRHNLEKSMKLLESFPHWRLSCQWHKFLGVR